MLPHTATTPFGFAEIVADYFPDTSRGRTLPLCSFRSIFEPTTRVKRAIPQFDACETGSYLHVGRLYEAQALRYANPSKIESFVVLAKRWVVIETQS